jgi:hypothetical protein
LCGGVYHQARWLEFCVPVAGWLVLMEFIFFPSGAFRLSSSADNPTVAISTRPPHRVIAVNRCDRLLSRNLPDL